MYPEKQNEGLAMICNVGTPRRTSGVPGRPCIVALLHVGAICDFGLYLGCL